MKLILITILTFCFCSGSWALSGEKSKKGDSLTLRRNYFMQIISDSSAVFDDNQMKLAAYDSLSKWALNEQDTLQYYQLQFDKGKVYRALGNMASAYNLYKSVLYQLSQKKHLTEEEEQFQRLSSLQIPSLLSSLGRQNEGLIFAYNLLRNYKDLDDYQVVSVYADIVCANIGVDPEKTRSYLQKAWALLDRLDANDERYVHVKSKVYNAQAGCLFSEQKVDSTIYYLNLIEKLDSRVNRKRNTLSILMNYVNVSCGMGDYAMASIYLHKLLSCLPPEFHSYMRGEALLQIVQINLDREGPTAQTMDYLHEAIDYSQQVGDLKTQYQSRLVLSRIYHDQGKYREEKDMKLLAYQVKDSLLTQLLDDRSFWATKDLEVQQLQAERMQSDNQVMSRKLSVRNWMLVVTSVLCVLFIIGAIIVYFTRKYKNMHRMMMAELEQQKTATQQNMNSIEGQIMTVMSQNLQKTNVLREIKDYLKRIRKAATVEEKDAECNNLEKHLREYEISTDKNEEIYLQFEMNHPKFVAHLKEYCDKLSDNEIHVCMLLVSDMTIKEIAALNNYAVRSVETIIYRSRKKLNLTPDIKTVDFLKKFLD